MASDLQFGFVCICMVVIDIHALQPALDSTEHDKTMMEEAKLYRIIFMPHLKKIEEGGLQIDFKSRVEKEV